MSEQSKSNGIVMNLREMKTLGEVCSKPQYGWTTSAAETGTIKLLRTTDITGGRIDWDTVPFCRDDPPDPAKYFIEDGDIVISRAGSVGASHRILAPQRAAFASYLIRFRPKPCLDGKYLAYYLQSPSYWAQVRGSTAGIAVPNVNASKLAAFTIPIVPLSAQQRVVAEIEKQFSHLDEALASLKRAQANLKRYKAAVLKAAVEGKLTEQWRKDHPDVEPASELLKRILSERRQRWQGQGKYKEPTPPDTVNLPILPDRWTWATVEQLSVLVQYGSSAKTVDDPKGIPVLRMGNIEDGRLNLNHLKYLPKNHKEFPSLFLLDGDLLFNRTNSAELVGKVSVYLGTPSPCSFASYLIRVRFSEFFLSHVAAYYIGSEKGRTWVTSVVSQQVGQANINGTKLQRLAVPLPPFREQRTIVDGVELRLSMAADLESAAIENLHRAKALRRGILVRAFQGERSDEARAPQNS